MVWPMLLVLAWSSVGFNLGDEVYTPVMKAAFNMPDPYGDLPTLETPQPDLELDWHEARAIGKRLMAEQARTQGFMVEREESISWSPEKGVFFYIVRSDRDLMDEGGGTWVMFDGTRGQFAGLSLPTGQNVGGTIHSWIFTLHMAMIWGMSFKIFVCATGLIVAMLSITGVYLWLKKRRAVAGLRRWQNGTESNSARDQPRSGAGGW